MKINLVFKFILLTFVKDIRNHNYLCHVQSFKRISSLTFTFNNTTMKKSTIIKKIEEQFVYLNGDNQTSGVSVKDDLKTNLMIGEETITHIFHDTVSTTTFEGENEIDWNDINLIDLDDDLLSEILSLLENYVLDLETTFERTRSYNY